MSHAHVHCIELSSFRRAKKTMTFVETFDLTEDGRTMVGFSADFSPRQPPAPVEIKTEDVSEAEAEVVGEVETVPAAIQRKSRSMAGIDMENMYEEYRPRACKANTKRKIAECNDELSSVNNLGENLFGERKGYRKRRELNSRSALARFLLNSFTTEKEASFNGVVYRVAKLYHFYRTGYVMDENKQLYQVKRGRVFLVEEDCNKQIFMTGMKCCRENVHICTFLLPY